LPAKASEIKTEQHAQPAVIGGTHIRIIVTDLVAHAHRQRFREFLHDLETILPSLAAILDRVVVHAAIRERDSPWQLGLDFHEHGLNILSAVDAGRRHPGVE